MDYLTKWSEAFAIPDQKAETIAKLFVENIVCCHGIPVELLSDRGTNFLSSLIQEVCKLLGARKINTGYHLQTDGLVEKFNSTLIAMIAKSCDTIEIYIYHTCYLHIGSQHKNRRGKLLLSSCMGETPKYLFYPMFSVPMLWIWMIMKKI